MAMKTNGYTESRARKNTSPSQLTYYNLRAMKTYGNTESHAGRKEDSWEAMDGSIEGWNQGTLTHSGQTPV